MIDIYVCCIIFIYNKYMHIYSYCEHSNHVILPTDLKRNQEMWNFKHIGLSFQWENEKPVFTSRNLGIRSE